MKLSQDVMSDLSDVVKRLYPECDMIQTTGNPKQPLEAVWRGGEKLPMLSTEQIELEWQVLRAERETAVVMPSDDERLRSEVDTLKDEISELKILIRQLLEKG